MVMSMKDFMDKDIVIGELDTEGRFVYSSAMVLHKHMYKTIVYHDIYLPRSKEKARKEIEGLICDYKEIYGEDF